MPRQRIVLLEGACLNIPFYLGFSLQLCHSCSCLQQQLPPAQPGQLPPSRRESLPPPLHGLAADVTGPKGQFRLISRLHPRQSREFSSSPALAAPTQSLIAPHRPRPRSSQDVQSQPPLPVSAGSEQQNIPAPATSRCSQGRTAGSFPCLWFQLSVSSQHIPAVPPGYSLAGIPLPVVCKALP